MRNKIVKPEEKVLDRIRPSSVMLDASEELLALAWKIENHG